MTSKEKEQIGALAAKIAEERMERAKESSQSDEQILKEEFLDALYEGLKESYPDCQDMVKEQFDLIKSGKMPTNVIGMFIEEDVNRFLKRKVRGD